MAVVLSSEDNSYFSDSSLRRSLSQPKFGTKQNSFHTSASTSRIHDLYQQPVQVFSDSAASSPPTSPHTTHIDSADTLSWSSTPATNLSADCEDSLDDLDSEQHIVLPQYNDAGFFGGIEEDLEPPLSPRTGDSYSVSPNGNETSTNTSRPDSPEVEVEHAEDDTAVQAQPSRHVDYLSHDWREEDIWSSWKYIVSKRGDYSNAARLENASWRTWIKAKNKLKTVSPETLNWLKDCDVTWLYGPLQTGHNIVVPSQTAGGSAHLSKSNSFLNKHKKPILKKRSMSEVMLQRSISTSSLVKQAAAAVQAQQKQQGGRRLIRPRLERASTDYVTFPFSSRRLSMNTSRLPSTASSGIASPGGERKHIHFNEKVEQCIAVDVKGEDDEEPEVERYNFDSDSDDGAIMMKKTTSKKRRPILKRSHSHEPKSTKTESKTIAMLPSTKLKYREDTPDTTEVASAMKHSTGIRSPGISPSSSQETLRPSKTSGKLFFVEDDDEDEEEDDDDDDDLPTIGARLSRQPGSSSGLHRSVSSGSLSAEPAGMRRTESGMFMPYEEGEPASANEGFFGRVIDTKKAFNRVSSASSLPKFRR